MAEVDNSSVAGWQARVRELEGQLASVRAEVCAGRLVFPPLHWGAAIPKRQLA